MHFLEKFYNKTIKYELINKFHYKKVESVPKLKKITLNFGCQTADMRQLSSSLLALELIANQKGRMTKTNFSNILFKIRKGNPTGCKITLSKFQMFNFLAKLLFEILPRLKSFTGLTLHKKIQNNVFSFKLYEMFTFNELENHYYIFNNLPELNITITANSKTKQELIFLLKSFQLPFIN